MCAVVIVLIVAAAASTAAAAVSCSVHDEKVDCGYVGIQEEECKSRSCCWKAGEPGPWCYQPQPTAGPTYTVADKQAQGNITILKLRLAEAVLPQYGPDFATLTVLVEPQTPQRLHVKISSDGSSGSLCGSRSASNQQLGARWEVPTWLVPRPPSEDFDPAAGLCSVQLPDQGQPFSFSVVQRSAAVEGQETTQQTVFDTAGTRLVFKEQYMELTTSLAASTTLYGLGETINPCGSLALPRDGRTVTLWNYDVASFNAGINLYGSHPFLLQLHKDGTASGVFLLNSNGMDVELQQTSLTYRVLGGVLDLYFLLGPGPEAVIQQYHDIIGRPAMPPYWALGFHQCRWGYQTLKDVEQVVSSYSLAHIPLEVIWTDIDYMYKYRDFTTDPERFPPDKFRAFVDKLHVRGQRWVPITDCGIPHAPDDPACTSGMAQGVFIKDVTGQPYLGQVWPGATHYPDFLAVNRTWPWWKDQLQRLWDKVPFDGMWIDMNEASNFCEGEVCHLPTTQGRTKRHMLQTSADRAPGRPGVQTALARLRQALLSILSAHSKPLAEDNPQLHQPTPSTRIVQTNCELSCSPPAPDNKLAFPPYAIDNLQHRVPLGSKTLPTTAQHVDGQLQYNTHNLYGLSEAAATRWALKRITGKRPFILSRSTFPGSGRHTAHWTGDNAATWQDLRWSVQGLINSNMWGLAMAGADICGFQGDTNEELCARWIAAGAFYTFTRNHNTLGAAPQELYRWPAVAAVARKALALRYRLLPYLYTCFYRVHTEGGTVARPLFFEFPADTSARSVSTQWMLDASVLVAPVLQEGTNKVDVYLPAATWYSLADYSRYTGPTTHTFTVPLTEPPPVFVRGGSMVALQEPANITEVVRQSPVTLVVALDRGRPGAAAAQDDLPCGKHRQHLQEPRSAQPYRSGKQSSCQQSLNIPQTGPKPGAGVAGMCRVLQTALVSCMQPAQPFTDTAEHCAGCRGSSPPGAAASSSAGVLLGCGSMYWDSGDSLEVPAEGAASMIFSSLAQSDTRRGWVVVAAEGSDVSLTAAAICAGSASDIAAGFGDRTGNENKQPAGSRAAGQGVPVVEEVQVLGVSPPASAGEVFVVLLDGQQLPPAQVAHAADREVLSVTGLQLQLGGVAQLEWHVTAAPVRVEVL